MRLIDATTLEVDLGPRVAGFRATTLPVETTMRLVVDVLATPSAAPAVTAPAPADLPPTLGEEKAGLAACGHALFRK